jgi:hypothetical protein
VAWRQAGIWLAQDYKFKTRLANTKPSLNSRPKPRLRHTAVVRGFYCFIKSQSVGTLKSSNGADSPGKVGK